MSRPTKLLALLLSLVFLCACGGNGDAKQSDAGATGDKVFRFINGPEPRYIDPALLTDSFGGFIAQNLFEGLVVWDAEAKTIGPGAAQEWTVSEDGLTWTFKLRSAARWSNGDPVTAQDFVHSWLRVLNPSTGSDYASLLYPIKGARELNLGETRDPSVLGVKALDNTTLEVTLENPNPQFSALVATAVYLPVNGRALKRAGWEWTRPENIVSNGPFVLDDWVVKEKFVLSKNNYYWDAASVKLDKVEAYSVNSADRLLDLWNSGTVHWTGPATVSILGDRISEVSGVRGFRRAPFLATWCLLFNVQDPVFADQRRRKAVAMSLDRAKVLEALGGDGTPARSLNPPGIQGYEPPAAPPYDPAEAKRLWAESGGPGKLELAIDRRGQSTTAAKELKRQLEEVLGIEVELFERDWRVHGDALDKGDFQVARWAWAGDYPAPATFLEPFLSDSGLNVGGYRSVGFDRLLDTASKIPDKSDQYTALRNAEQVLLEELPVLPVFHLNASHLLSDQVAGFEENLLDLHLLKYLDLRAS